jgi:hypothetical protein
MGGRIALQKHLVRNSFERRFFLRRFGSAHASSRRFRMRVAYDFVTPNPWFVSATI